MRRSLMMFSSKTFAAGIVGIVLALVPVAQGIAQDSAKDNESTFMSPQTYRRITQATEARNAERYDEALEELQDLAGDVAGKPYELAVTLQTIAYVYISQDK